MNRTRWIWAVVISALIAAGCGNDDGGDVGQPVEPAQTAEPVQTAEPTQTAELVDPGTGDIELVIGQVMPETGSLAFLNSPMIEGVGLAIEDIVEAGGNVRLLTGDTATDPDVAPETVNRLLGEGSHVIVGAAASGVSQSFIQTLYDAQIPQCSPSNTSPSFSTQENAGFYFRTVPPDQAVSPILAGIVAADGATNVAIAARADDWGNALSSLLAKSFTELGVAYQIIAFDEDATSYDATVAAIEDMGADAVVLVTFSEGAQIIRGLLEAGIPPEVMYGTDGIYDRNLADTVDPSNPNVLDGFVALTAGGGDVFSERLIARTGGDVAYGGQAYDCVVVLALAALAAGSNEGPAIIGQVQTITRGGQKCFSYAECAGLIAEGADIDYDGVSGPLELDDVGDPTFGRYIIAEFIDGELTVTGSQDVDLAELG